MSGLPEFRLKAIGLTVVAGLAFGLTGMASASAQEGKPGEAAVPTSTTDTAAAPLDPIAKAAFNVLEKHCARCHQQGKLVERERPAKNFGNILKLDAIASNPHYVLPGNPLGSKLFRQIADKEMPYDINYEGETRYPNVSEADIKALEDWISALGTKATASCEAHKFITSNDMIAAMAKDLDSQLPQRRQTTRYLTLTHLAN